MKLISSNIYISIQGSVDIFNEKHIIKAFEEIFPHYEIVSDVKAEEYREIIYSIAVPVIENNDNNKEFYADLEILLEELAEYKPHFTQFGGDNK